MGGRTGGRRRRTTAQLSLYFMKVQALDYRCDVKIINYCFSQNLLETFQVKWCQ